MPISAAALASALWLKLAPIDHARCYRNCQMSEMGTQLVMHFEGYSPIKYKDAAGYLTIGHGHLIREGEEFAEPLMPEEAAKLLKRDMRAAEDGMNRNVVVAVKQNQADAVISIIFNIGEGKMARSTLIKKVNLKEDDEVPPQFRRWVYAGGKPLSGLLRRREAEAKLYAAD